MVLDVGQRRRRRSSLNDTRRSCDCMPCTKRVSYHCLFWPMPNRLGDHQVISPSFNGIFWSPVRRVGYKIHKNYTVVLLKTESCVKTRVSQPFKFGVEGWLFQKSHPVEAGDNKGCRRGCTQIRKLIGTRVVAKTSCRRLLKYRTAYWNMVPNSDVTLNLGCFFRRNLSGFPFSSPMLCFVARSTRPILNITRFVLFTFSTFSPGWVQNRPGLGEPKSRKDGPTVLIVFADYIDKNPNVLRKSLWLDVVVRPSLGLDFRLNSSIAVIFYRCGTSFAARVRRPLRS